MTMAANFIAPACQRAAVAATDAVVEPRCDPRVMRSSASPPALAGRGRSERDVVVVFGAAERVGRAFVGRRRAPVVIVVAAGGLERLRAPAAPAAASRQQDVAGVDLGFPALLAVAALEARGAKRAFHEDARALAEDLAEALGALSPDDDVVPVGAL